MFGAVDDDNRGVIVEATGNPQGGCGVALGDGTSFKSISELTLKQGQLNHIVVSGDTQTMAVHLNGVLAYSGPQPKMLRQERVTFVVGSQFGQNAGGKGLIREVAVSGQCVTPGSIAQLQ